MVVSSINGLLLATMAKRAAAAESPQSTGS